MFIAHVIRPTWKALWLRWFQDVLAAGNRRLVKIVSWSSHKSNAHHGYRMLILPLRLNVSKFYLT